MNKWFQWINYFQQTEMVTMKNDFHPWMVYFWKANYAIKCVRVDMMAESHVWKLCGYGHQRARHSRCKHVRAGFRTLPQGLEFSILIPDSTDVGWNLELIWKIPVGADFYVRFTFHTIYAPHIVRSDHMSNSLHYGWHGIVHVFSQIPPYFTIVKYAINKENSNSCQGWTKLCSFHTGHQNITVNCVMNMALGNIRLGM